MPAQVPRRVESQGARGDVYILPEYETWLGAVRNVLAAMRMEPSVWQENWEFDFRKEYARGVPARDAALHAHDYWWQQLLAESWT